MTTIEDGLDVGVRALRESDLTAADRVIRLAFGTFLGLPEPMAFMGDADFVHTRWRADPSSAFAAENGGEVVGSNFATHWGSVGFFGPLTIRPDLWDRGIGRWTPGPFGAITNGVCAHRRVLGVDRRSTASDGGQ